ncbi:hypothetical protein N7456_002147 [Penicillium angulare]|uniref:Major facilitator superfamily (MFS) profile domain-containing protein n=1 Tax=Penicillium angulare TaxID=116970 RepID=A0A9W9G837_9EURO|nr:hypothetical protein N7456_002147 [Penicillium angulare]
MAFGVLSIDPLHGHPPGTTLLEKVQPESHGIAMLHIPQPSDSKHDPLNMTRLRRELYFITLIYGACVTGVVGPLLVPGFSIIATAFEIDLTQVTLLNGSLVMALGVSAYICSPLASAYGRRLVYLFTTLMMIFGCVWGSYAQTYRSLLGSRIFQGLGMGSFFSLAGTASINDVFFVHERGRRAGLWNFAVIVSVNVAPVISGYVIMDLSWQWSFRILAIAFAISFVLVLFLMPETIFDRSIVNDREPTDNSGAKERNIETDQDFEKSVIPPTTQIYEESFKDSGATDEYESTQTNSAIRRVLGIEIVKFKSIKELSIMLIRPFTLIFNPIVLWACAMWSVTFSWTIIQGAVADQIYEAAPYNLSPTAVGLLIGIPPLIGSAIGTVLGGILCDLAANNMAIRNSGIYEPEFRLPVLLPGIIATCIGSYGIGIAIADGLTVWASAVFLGFLNFGVGMSCTAIITYTNDACQDRAADAFGLAMLVKSAFAFGLTFILNDYYVSHGARIFFITWAALTTGITVLTVPLYIFGKRIRASRIFIGVAR